MPSSTRPHLRGALVLALALLGLAAFAPAAFADGTIRVTTLEDRVGGECAPFTGQDPAPSCSLREAIELAADGEPALSGEVTIEFGVTGTIEVGHRGVLNLHPGTGVANLTIEGPGREDLTIDGQRETRVFKAEDGVVTISGLTVAKGLEDDFAVDGDGGGALYMSEPSTVKLEDVLLTENGVESARDGGAIDVEGGYLTIVDSTIEQSTTDADLLEAGGGAINIDSAGAQVTVRGSEIVHNIAGEGAGGGISQQEGTLIVEDSLIAENTAHGGSGGGIFAEPNGAHKTTITGSTIRDNSTSEYGGGILADTGSGGLSVTGSTISGNKAIGGGGLRVEGSTTVSASTLSGNEATSGEGGGAYVDSGSLLLETATLAENIGGAIYARGGSIQVHGSTLSANSNPSGEAGGITAPAEEATITVRSSIVAGNTGSGGGSADCAAEITTEGNNIAGTMEQSCVWPVGEGDQLGVTAQLAPLADNGGPTKTMAPESASSLAINHGSTPQPEDQRGLPRPVPTGAANTDVGAVEVQAPVNQTAPAIDPSAGIVTGTELSCNPGSWDADTVTDPQTSYAWLVEGQQVEAGASYTTVAADAGKEIACRVTVDNGATATAATSAPVHFGPATAVLTPAEFDFGERRINGNEPQAAHIFTLKNKGGEDLAVTAITSSDAAQFPLELSYCDGGEIVLASGESCEFSVSFEPTAGGPQSSTIAVASNGGSASAAVSGTGLAAEFTITPASFDFGEVQIGGLGPAHGFVVKNVGQGTDEVDLGTLEGEFQFQSGCEGIPLAPGEECTVLVAFEPSTLGAKTGLLKMSGGGEPSATLSGTGTLPAFAANPEALEFGSQEVDTTTVKTVSISNTGTGTAKVESVQIEGINTPPFTLPSGGDKCTGAELGAGESCTVEVAFAPAAVGSAEASLEVEGTTPAHTGVLLTGTGVAKPAPPAPPTPPAPAPPQPAPVVPEAPKLTAKSAKRSGNALLVKLTCRTYASRCQGQLTLSAAQGGTKVAAGKVSVAPGTRQARLTLTAAGKRLLEAEPRLRLTAKATASDPVYQRSTTTKKVLRLGVS